MAQLLHVHGSENHFYILDQTELNTPLTEAELTKLAQTVTKQATLLHAADGLLVVDHSDHPGTLGRMEVVNADGSRASMCGNGLRCVSRYLAEKHHQTDFKVETPAADLQVSQQPDFAEGVPAFAVEISPVRYQAKDFPFQNLGMDKVIDQPLPMLNDHLKFTTIAVPNPHLISFVETDTDLNDTLGAIGERLNGQNEYFPDGVNVNFAKILGPNKLFVRTFERGVGFTNACGTGMSATSLAFALTHPAQVDVTKPIQVLNPGGMVKTVVHTGDRQWIDLIGNATFTERVTVDEQLLKNATLSVTNTKVYSTGEENDYQRFVDTIQK